MDFSSGRGRYTRLNARKMPRFGLAYLTEEHFGTLESGQVHSRVRYRWDQGDAEVRRVMRQIAQCAERGKNALAQDDRKTLGRLMNRNFDLRRRLFGDEALGTHNLELIEIARGLGLAAKLPGSSGAALILLSDEEAEAKLAEAYASKGYRYRPIEAM